MRRSAAAVIAGLVLVTGCSGEEAPRTSAERISVVKSTARFSYSAYEDPADMLSKVDIAVVGTITSVGRIVIDDELNDHGGALVTVEPHEVWKRPSGSTGPVYYVLNWPRESSLEQLELALPEGSDVVLFGESTAGRIRLGAGRPTGGVYEPVPEGLWLSSDSGGISNVWGEYSQSAWTAIDSVDELRRATGIS
jgi:hypothetical protein